MANISTLFAPFTLDFETGTAFVSQIQVRNAASKSYRAVATSPFTSTGAIGTKAAYIRAAANTTASFNFWVKGSSASVVTPTWATNLGTGGKFQVLLDGIVKFTILGSDTTNNNKAFHSDKTFNLPDGNQHRLTFMVIAGSAVADLEVDQIVVSGTSSKSTGGWYTVANEWPDADTASLSLPSSNTGAYDSAWAPTYTLNLTDAVSTDLPQGLWVTAGRAIWGSSAYWGTGSSDARSLLVFTPDQGGTASIDYVVDSAGAGDDIGGFLLATRMVADAVLNIYVDGTIVETRTNADGVVASKFAKTTTGTSTHLSAGRHTIRYEVVGGSTGVDTALMAIDTLAFSGTTPSGYSAGWNNAGSRNKPAAFAPTKTIDFEDGQVPSYLRTQNTYGVVDASNWGVDNVGSKALMLFVNGGSSTPAAHVTGYVELDVISAGDMFYDLQLSWNLNTDGIGELLLDGQVYEQVTGASTTNNQYSSHAIQIPEGFHTLRIQVESGDGGGQNVITIDQIAVSGTRPAYYAAGWNAAHTATDLTRSGTMPAVAKMRAQPALRPSVTATGTMHAVAKMRAQAKLRPVVEATGALHANAHSSAQVTAKDFTTGTGTLHAVAHSSGSAVVVNHPAREGTLEATAGLSGQAETTQFVTVSGTMTAVASSHGHAVIQGVAPVVIAAGTMHAETSEHASAVVLQVVTVQGTLAAQVELFSGLFIDIEDLDPEDQGTDSEDDPEAADVVMN